MAEDCTQEVFLALSKKMHKLKLDTNVEIWLYKSAKIEILRCYKKRHDDISIDELDDIPEEKNENAGILDNIITEDEYQTLNEYYINKQDVKEMSADRNISEPAMYQRIHRIKQKIYKNADKLHNLLKK